MRTADRPERPLYLVLVVVPPVIWAMHFALTYLIVSIACAKPGILPAPALGAPTLIMLMTAAALAAIGATGWSGYQRHTHGGSSPPHDADTPEDRDRFLGRASMMLAGLSAVATIYVALATLMVGSCR